MKALLPLSLATAAMAITSVAHAGSTEDRHFVSEAMKGDNSEVALGNLAVKRGASAAVRRYGQMLAMDHGQHRQKLARLGQHMGVSRTSQLSDAGEQARSMLLGLHGRQFDEAFRTHMIDDHREDIGKYQVAASSSASPALRVLAKQTLPTLRKHLRTAQAL